MNSIIQNEKECFICKTKKKLQCHHIFFGKGCRQLSEEHELKNLAENVWLEKNNKTTNDFIKIFGKNYL